MDYKRQFTVLQMHMVIRLLSKNQDYKHVMAKSATGSLLQTK